MGYAIARATLSATASPSSRCTSHSARSMPEVTAPAVTTLPSSTTRLLADDRAVLRKLFQRCGIRGGVAIAQDSGLAEQKCARAHRRHPSNRGRQIGDEARQRAAPNLAWHTGVRSVHPAAARHEQRVRRAQFVGDVQLQPVGGRHQGRAVDAYHRDVEPGIDGRGTGEHLPRRDDVQGVEPLEHHDLNSHLLSLVLP